MYPCIHVFKNILHLFMNIFVTLIFQQISLQPLKEHRIKRSNYKIFGFCIFIFVYIILFLKFNFSVDNHRSAII